jgi:hypothetical protein
MQGDSTSDVSSICSGTKSTLRLSFCVRNRCIEGSVGNVVRRWEVAYNDEYK